MKRALYLVVCCVVLFSRAAVADDARAALTFVAPATCPSREALLTQVAARTSEARFSDDEAGGLVFRVRITASPPGFGAVLKTRKRPRRGGVRVETRTLQGETCEAIVDALSLVIALAMDPNASWALPMEERAATPEPLTAPMAPASEPSHSTRLLPAEGDRSTAISLSSSSSSSSSNPPARRWVPFLGGALATELGTLPHAALAAAVVLGVEREHGIFAPAVALELSMATSDLTPTSAPRGSYTRGMVRGEACPLNVEPSEVISIRPCAWIGVGFLRAEGTAAPVSLTDTSTWEDAGVRLQARARGRRLFVEVSVGAVVPLVRPRFVTASPRIVLYETPPVGGLLAMGAGLRF